MRKFFTYICCVIVAIVGFVTMPKHIALADGVVELRNDHLYQDEIGGSVANNTIVHDFDIEEVGEEQLAILSEGGTICASVANNTEYRIDNSEIISNMTIFPDNQTSECGLVGMAIMLQFYNDLPTKYLGKYIPNDEMNYNSDPTMQDSDKQLKTEKLKKDLDDRTEDMLWGLFGTGTTPNTQYYGMTSYIDKYCPNIGVTVNTWYLAFGMRDKLIELLDDNIPVLVSALYYDFEYKDFLGNTFSSSGENHSFIVYGYRKQNDNLQFLSHLGWHNTNNKYQYTECWVDINTLGGFVFLTDVPLSNFTAEKSANGENTYVTGLNNPSEEEFEIPQRLLGRPVTKIDNNAFKDCTNIESITIPDTVTSIGDNAFKGCTSLTSIVIPETVTEIGDGVFDGCTSLTNVTLPSTITKISGRMFKGCSSLTSFTIAPSITEIGEDAFRDCTGFTSMVIPQTVTEIGDGVFDGCTNLTGITLPTTIIKIRDRMFKGCVSLANFTIAPNITEIGASAFMGVGLSSIVIPNTVTNIGKSAFEDCDSLTSITIPNSINSLSEELFSNCDNLYSVALPSTLTSIEAEVFYGCENLTSITLPSSLTDIGTRAFMYSGLQEIIIPNTVATIGDEAFYKCQDLTAVTLPNSLEIIAESVFSETGIEEISIPSGVESIGYGAFQFCSNLESVLLPTSLNIIEDYAFCNTGIAEISIPTNVVAIGMCAFSGCDSLSVIALPNSLTSLGEYAFYGCVELTSINLPTSLTEIKEEMFYGCELLSNVVIPNSVTAIGERAFYGCTSLDQMIIPNTVLSMGDYAFANCALMTLYIETDNGNLDEWGENWSNGCVHIWQTTLSEDNSYVVSFYKGSPNANYTFMSDPTRVGYTFGGWSFSQDFSETLYTCEEICTVPQGSTLYAYWIGQTVNISYKDVGGTRFMGIHAIGYPTTHTNGVDTVLLSPSRPDYMFVGWYLISAGTGASVSTIKAEDSYDSTITLYAKWKKVAFTPIIKTSLVDAEILTENGSYIDSEGNVYLVEEDIDDYLNGTLTFFKKDDYLETI
ncbi:MAG: leucine-rich repeat protein [Clostridia bacterium]|nr:leucine-rich repeat protein [Clostridia bacterium]